MKFSPASLAGLWLVDLDRREDERGFFARTFCENEFRQLGLNTRWPQCNLSQTKQCGSIRGMHWQDAPKPEIKLIRCLAGAVFDVLVDVRRESPTCGQWQGFELSATNYRQLYVPAGFAHGFQCLTDNCEMYYQMSEFYVPELARGLRWNDPAIGIRWPLEPTVIAQKDRQFPDFVDSE